MKKQDCFELGYITKAHALDGEVTAFFDVDDPSPYLDIESVFVERKGQLVPYLIEYIHPANKTFIIKLEEVDDRDTAEELINTALYLPQEMLPKLEESQFYYHEIIGFTVKDKERGELGKVENVYSTDMQALVVMLYQEKEVLIPVNDDIVQLADRENQVLHVTLPEGLLDVYLEE